MGFIVGAVVAAAVALAVVMFLRADPTGRRGHGLPKEYTYDVGELGKVDPKLILFRQAWRFESGLTDARAVAVGPAGRIYLAGDEVVRILPAEAAEGAPDPAQVGTIDTAGRADCLAVAEDGTIYAGVAGRVRVYDGQGKLKATWPAPADEALLTAIAVTDEDVFVADARNRVVHRYDRSGKLLGRIGRRDPERNIPGFIVPSPHFDLSVAPDGLLRAVNPGRLRVEAYTPRGDLERWWGESGSDIGDFTGCCNPVSLAILPDGRFVTCEKGIRRVKLYDGDGKFVGVVAPPAAFAADRPARRAGRGQPGELDVAVDAKARVFVLDPYAGEVKVFVRKAEAK